MSGTLDSTDGLEHQAVEKARSYQWATAKTLYQRALSNINRDRDRLTAARLSELIAKSTYNEAFQSESRGEFVQKIQAAQAAYEETVVLYSQAGAAAQSKRSKAKAHYVNFWLADKPDERRQILQRCIEQAEEAIQLFEELPGKKGLGDAYSDLSAYLLSIIPMISEEVLLKTRIHRAVEIGEKARALQVELDEAEGILEAINSAINVASVFEDIVGPSAQSRVEELGRRVTELCEKVGTPYASCLEGNSLAWIALFDKNYGRALDLSTRSSKQTVESKNRMLIGHAGFRSSLIARRKELAEEDTERKKEAIDEGFQAAQLAIQCGEVINYRSLLAVCCLRQVQLLTDLATRVETDPKEKISLLRTAVDVGRNGMIYKNHNPGTEASGGLSLALLCLARMSVNDSEKRALLNEAEQLRAEILREYESMEPGSLDHGVEIGEFALIKAELANVEENPQTKVHLLQEAASNMQQSIAIGSPHVENPARMAVLASREESFGDILVKLYPPTTRPDEAKHAIKQYENSMVLLHKLGFTGSSAAVSWKLARIHDAVGDYTEASEAFNRAAGEYRASAKKTIVSASAFEQLASYMEAWVEVERARLRHEDEQFHLAADSYKKVSEKLSKTRDWNHLVNHYEACSLLETGEALSRQEKPEAAAEAFEEATSIFQKTTLDLENNLKNEGRGESEELGDWLRITRERAAYSHGRSELEHAKVLDKKGDEEGSAKKYRSASETFERLLADTHNPQSRSEMETLMLFCQAWTKMKEAETEASPEAYGQAATLFLKAKEASRRKRFRLLAQANASICRALEAGANFRLTHNTQLYSEIKNHMHTAAEYYQESSFENAAGWTRATQRLFDALTYLAAAEAEIDSKKKTELYHLAEKYLELAARLYDEAGFNAKKEEALRYLKRVREDKELLLTPVQALAENPALSGSPVASISLVRDQALGLDRFEAAIVVGNIGILQKQLSVGAELTLEVELANIGKTAATLIKLENLVPNGLEVDVQKISHRVEDNYIDMKGKRLEYLKTHEMKVPLKAVRKGAFEVKPKVLFVDEKGNYRSYEFEPAAVTVSELGISGWLKGPK